MKQGLLPVSSTGRRAEDSGSSCTVHPKPLSLNPRSQEAALASLRFTCGFRVWGLGMLGDEGLYD